MRLGLGGQIGLDEHHHVQRLGKRRVARLQLIDARFDPVVDGRLAQQARRHGTWIDLVTVDAVRPTPGIRAVVGQV